MKDTSELGERIKGRRRERERGRYGERNGEKEREGERQGDKHSSESLKVSTLRYQYQSWLVLITELRRVHELLKGCLIDSK